MFQFDKQSNDYLLIHDGQSPRIFRSAFASQQFEFPISIYRNGSHILVNFVTDHEMTGLGFTAFFHSNLEKYSVCDLALDLEEKTLIIDSKLPKGTYCDWLIKSQDNGTYVTLEFQEFNVRNIIAIKEWFKCINSNS